MHSISLGKIQSIYTKRSSAPVSAPVYCELKQKVKTREAWE